MSQRDQGSRHLRAAGNLETAFLDVLFLAASPGGAAFQGSLGVLVISGRMKSGRFGVQLLPVWRRGPRASDLQPPLLAAPDEVWITAGLVADHLYVLDALRAHVLRLAAPAWAPQAFCLMDPEFDVLVPVPHRGGYSGFKLEPGYTVRLARGAQNGSLHLIRVGPTGYEYTHRDLTPPDAFTFARAPVGGQTRLLIQGPPRRLFSLQTAARESGPWTPASTRQSLPDGKSAQVLLSQPLAAGAWLRLVDGISGRQGPPVAAGPTRPVIQDVQPLAMDPVLGTTHLAAGEPFEIRGDLLAGISRVTFQARPLHGVDERYQGSWRLAILDRRPGRLLVLAPAIQAQGRLIIGGPRGQDSTFVRIAGHVSSGRGSCRSTA